MTTVVWLRIYDSAEEHPNHLEMTPLEMGQLRHSDENIGGCVSSWWDWLHWKWENPLLLKGIGRACYFKIDQKEKTIICMDDAGNFGKSLWKDVKALLKLWFEQITGS